MLVEHICMFLIFADLYTGAIIQFNIAQLCFTGCILHYLWWRASRLYHGELQWSFHFAIFV